uniref:Uncharacterized protein n=1 Tax=Cryptomonas curvata TaxID=233186 RepID=A0A7S0MHC3_9CRYP|mmetsp:Transcript_37742/g.79034  ORF Transcript_37742/g.79034 Transcript_37742/m.79034 type:complete len:176 (+) Transcript_37742:206-733(+)
MRAAHRRKVVANRGFALVAGSPPGDFNWSTKCLNALSTLSIRDNFCPKRCAAASACEELVVAGLKARNVFDIFTPKLNTGVFIACIVDPSIFETESATTWSNAAWAEVLEVVDEVTGAALSRHLRTPGIRHRQALLIHKRHVDIDRLSRSNLSTCTGAVPLNGTSAGLPTNFRLQ